MSEGVDENQSAMPVKSRAKRVRKSAKLTADVTDAPARRTRKPKAATASGTDAPSSPSQKPATENTPLRIPYGNKEVAQRLGARYAAGGWYAPPGVDLAAFSAQGWL